MSDHPGQDRQVEIYTEGAFGDGPPEFPVRYERLKREAQEALSPEAYAYVAGAAGGERTKRANREAFDRWRIVQRMLRDVSERDFSTELFGTELQAPVALAPIGVQSIIHDEGERASARAAADLGLPFVSSSAASTPMEEIAEETGDAPAWFQLYCSSDRGIARSFLDRAEAAGYEAVVVTVDTPMMGWRERDIEHAYLPFLDGEGVANYFSDPVFRERLADPPEETPGAAITRFIEAFGDPSLSWDDLTFLREHTDLPILVKGLVHPDDAARAIEAGIDGVIVSNHGGRQVDGAVGALDALPGIVERIGDDVPVLFDSGIRRGADVFRALALGADIVLFGRPYVYGLALDGEEGVREVCKNLLADLDLTMALSGRTGVEGIDRSALRRRDDLMAPSEE